MQPLDKALRNPLEKTIKKARPVAERAAHAALEQLGVADAKAPAWLDENQKDLRRRLRAHARSLGDALRADIQSTGWLVAEIAYEHWHRMLFARFLADNDLLMYDGVAITLDECEELAADEGMASGWALAGQLASGMLPQVFRTESPVFELTLAAEHQRELESLLAGLPVDVFHASDSLGWVYQFWQSDNKEQINQSEVKIGADELPAVTQLFTEPYMVSFLLDNALGAWWAARRLSEADLYQASSEEELREKAALPGVPLTYLRFVQEEDTNGQLKWTPAAGTFDAWPEHLGELKTLDPCCGSGHFLVAAFAMLVPMRVELENLSAREAVDAVLRDNLHGLELDPRCVELAAFALALAAWRYPRAGGYRPLPELQLACSGLPVSAAKEDWKQLSLGKQNLRIALDWLHDAFQNAPTLGSLLNPARSDAAKVVEWDTLAPMLEQALEQEHSDEQYEAGVVAQGLAKAATLLAGEYQWVITNVPYLQRGKQNQRLRDFCQRNYPAAKNDLATVFLDRCLELCVPGGTTSTVLPQNWLFLTTYRKFREKLLQHNRWHLIARLGPGAFETISGEVVKAILLNLSRGNANGQPGGLFANEKAGALIRGVDISEPRTAAEKAAGLVSEEIKTVGQAQQLENPDTRVLLDDASSGQLLEVFANYNKGVCTGDDPRFRKSFWEIGLISDAWIGFQSTAKKDKHFGGLSDLLLWEGGTGSLFLYVEERLNGQVGSWLRGQKAWAGTGVTIQCMRTLPAQLYLGEAFDSNVVTITPRYKADCLLLWVYMKSAEYKAEVRKLNQKMNVGDDTFIKVPFDREYWEVIAKEQYPHGLPEPYSDNPTQWLFHGHPCGSVIWDEDSKWTAHGPLRTDDIVLQVAVARLLGYRWPAELDEDMELAHEARAWVKETEALLPLADQDGIVCIPPVRGETGAADRLFKLLVAAYGDEWSNDVLAQLLKSVGHDGKTLESWLRDRFFAQHCKLFHNRPFIWHIWDGLKDGFSTLVNYHRLDYKTLETLTYTYLGDWITAQNRAVKEGVDGAEEKLAAARALQKSLTLILEGEGYPEDGTGYDIFVRWKPLAEQPIGWNPDLNDGVRLNIRPFMSAPDVKKKGAGILRDKPNIKWNKDRGKDVPSAPWYHLGLEYGGKEGDRINDHHLTLAEKQNTRASSV